MHKLLALAAVLSFSHHAPASHSQLTLPALPPAPASTVWFHLAVNDGLKNVGRVERALVDQEAQVADVWHLPPIRFGATGIPIYVMPHGRVAPICGGLAAGCHALAPNEAIYVENFAENITLGDINQNSMTSALSHEILEASVDPDGTRAEICDPVEWRDYRLDGVEVSDWTYPSFFNDGQAPYDWLSSISTAAST